MLGLAVGLAALVAVAVSGAAFAAGGNATANGNQGEECPYSDCVPNFYNWDYNYGSPGPHGAQNGKVS
jgi:hypothetical protein